MDGIKIESIINGVLIVAIIIVGIIGLIIH